jgi:hypothetical protein
VDGRRIRRLLGLLRRRVRRPRNRISDRSGLRRCGALHRRFCEGVSHGWSCGGGVDGGDEGGNGGGGADEAEVSR